MQPASLQDPSGPVLRLPNQLVDVALERPDLAQVMGWGRQLAAASGRHDVMRTTVP